MERYARRVERDAAVARRRSLTRRLGGKLVWKYLQIVPSVFTTRGAFAAFEMLISAEETIDGLDNSAVLTLDSASERLGGFRFGRGRDIYAYFGNASALDALVKHSKGRRLPGHLMPLLLAPHDQDRLFAVVCEDLPPHFEHGGQRFVTREHLVRDLLGFYGLRLDLIVEIENKLGNVSN
jgi:hypothetical protein